jgi:hypothetical protein
MYTQLGVLTKGTIIEVNVSELGMVTAGGKVVFGKYAQITNNPENDGCINAVLCELFSLSANFYILILTSIFSGLIALPLSSLFSGTLCIVCILVQCIFAYLFCMDHFCCSPRPSRLDAQCHTSSKRHKALRSRSWTSISVLRLRR